LITRRTFTNFASFLLSKAGAIIFFIVGVRFFIHGAGQQEYGAINLVLVLYTYLWIADIGIGYAVNLRLGQALARQAETGDSRSTIAFVSNNLAKVAPFYLSIGLLVAVFGVIASDALSAALFDERRYADLVTWTAMAAPAVMLSAMSGAVLRAHDRVYLVNATQLLLDAWRAGCMIALATSADPAVAAGRAFFAGAVARALLDVILLSRFAGWSWLIPQWNWGALAADLRTGAPTMGSLVISSVFYSVDRVFAAKHFSLEGVAVYSLAADLHTKAYFLLWAFNAAIYQPLVARHALKANAQELAFFNLGGAALIGFIYYLPMSFFSNDIISLWINESSAASAQPVVWAMLPGSIGYLVAASLENSYLRTRGLVLGPMLVHLAMLLSLIAGLSILPAYFGLAGIGWAHSLANCIFAIGIALLVALTRVKR